MRASEQAQEETAFSASSARVVRPVGRNRVALAIAPLLCGALALAATGTAFALKTDKDQQTNIDANYSKRVDSKTGTANDPDVTDLDGDVVITKGTIKMTSAHATIYSIPSGAKTANAGKVARTVLTGKQAHMQQLHDGDCSLMTADADKIDYNPFTNIADLSGNVVVVQAGRGEFRGQHIIYNTDTGDMESGDMTSNAGRVHMVMEPGDKKPAPVNNPTCAGVNTTPPKPAAAPAAAPASAAAPKPADAAKPATPAPKDGQH
jgi:lipopolysaccharide export system protein LptA